MTIAERNNKLKHFITCLKCEVSGKCCDDNCSTQYDAGNMDEIIENLEAISKALEPQSFKWCTDCKEYDQEKHCCHRWSKVIRDTVEEMKQEPKTGHWEEHNTGHSTYYDCSLCGCLAPCTETADSFIWKLSNFCPDCGAKMVEPQESEAEDGECI